MYEIVNNRKILVGENALLELPANLQWYSVTKAFVVVYHPQAEIVEKTLQLLASAGIGFCVYQEVTSEPGLWVIDRGAEIYAESGCDCVIAIGGGSVIDAAKTIAMLAANGGKAEEYQMMGRQVLKPAPLFVAVPTTAGTGAEATKVSVVINNHNHWKKAIYHTSMIAELVILEPTACFALPRHIAVATGMDAITHAIESYVSLNANPVTEMYSLQALQLLVENITAICENPKDAHAWEMMLLGSYFAGCAIAAGTGLAHIVGQPLGALHAIPHGDACAIFLVPSMKANMLHSLLKYVSIAKVLGVNVSEMPKKEAAEAGIRCIGDLATRLGAPQKLTPYLKDGDFDLPFAIETIQGSMGHLKNNPRPVEPGVLAEMMQSVL